MNNYTMKYYDFINLYNSLLLYLTKKGSFYQICFYYLDNKFNLEIIDKDEKWLFKELKIKGKELQNILLATVDINEKINFYEKNKNVKGLNVLE